MTTTSTLYHYTCEHGRKALGEVGTLLPVRVHAPDSGSRVAEARQALGVNHPEEELQPLLDLIWLTDLTIPDRGALGMNPRTTGGCDRGRYRYRVTDTSECLRYLDVWPQYLSRGIHLQLTDDDLALPGRWWVAVGAVPVEFAPVPTRLATARRTW